MRRLLSVMGVVLIAGTAASADMHKTLQLDINGIGLQARDGAGAATPFGGLGHSGALDFSFAPGVTNLLGVFIQQGMSPPVNQGFNGHLTNFDGVINLHNGAVTGGHLMVTVNGVDTFTAQVSPGIGQVTPFVGGGYKVEGLTYDGFFSGPMFGNVDVSTWFNIQPILGGHPGSFLSFNFDPGPTGAAYADMDVFIEVIPLPPAAWMGLATMVGFAGVRYARRRQATS